MVRLCGVVCELLEQELARLEDAGQFFVVQAKHLAELEFLAVRESRALTSASTPSPGAIAPRTQASTNLGVQPLN